MLAPLPAPVYLQSAEARSDPDILNTLAVAAGCQGQRQQALLFLRRAAALLPAWGADELRRVLDRNRQAVAE